MLPSVEVSSEIGHWWNRFGVPCTDPTGRNPYFAEVAVTESTRSILMIRQVKAPSGRVGTTESQLTVACDSTLSTVTSRLSNSIPKGPAPPERNETTKV